MSSTSDITSDITWDGRVRPYRPQPGWEAKVSPGLSLHSGEEPSIDPVTLEIIRNRLWTINIAHGETVMRVSGSPVFQLGDFSMSILTETGEVVMAAPYVQFLNAGAPLAVPYILENLSDNPGIEEGDIFLCNDPWIGAVHQMDVFLGMPVFVDGSLFAWVTNAGHQYDLGGVAAGGWPENAATVFDDPVVIPPFKLVERGVVRKDLEAAYLRHSRFPGLIALDLKSQIAGCRYAAAQLLATCEEFGAGTVKAAMRAVLSSASDSFASKLQRMPDGDWSEVMYFDEKLPGDRSSQRVEITFKKRGDKLVVSNAGTDPQDTGPNGLTFAAFSGAVLGALQTVMLQDHLFAVGAVARNVEFDVTPGLLTCVEHPAAVAGGILNTDAVFHASISLASRMMSSHPDLARDAIATGCEYGLAVVSGMDDRGTGFGTAFIEQPGGAGATAWRDGIDTGGFIFAPLAKYLDVEDQEAFYPVLILWRRQLPDSGGAGRWRGGGGVEFGATEYRSAAMRISTNTGGMAVSGTSGRGLMGGLPTPTIEYRHLVGTDIAARMERSQMPTSVDELSSEDRKILRGKSTGNVLGAGDVFSARFPGGAGYGDPLKREPERVVADVAEGWVTPEVAHEIYGVVVADGALDAAATDTRRQEMLAERLSWTPVSALASPPEAKDVESNGAPPMSLLAYVTEADRGSRRIIQCSECGHEFAQYLGSYVHGLLIDEQSIQANPGVGDPHRFVDTPILLRRYCCPGCAVLVLTSVVLEGEPHASDLVLVGSPRATATATSVQRGPRQQ